MAQLKDLIVSGASRFLGKIFAKDLLVSGSTTIGNNLTMTASDGNTHPIITIAPDSDAASAYGSLLTIQGGGDTYIGGGESATALQGATGATTSENMYVSADSNVYIVPNCNTVANRKTFTFNTSGHLVVPTGTDYTTYRARNIAANTNTVTAGSSALTNGNIYLQYV